MGFKTLIVKNYGDGTGGESFQWTPIIDEGDIAFVMDDSNRILYVWHGVKASMIKRYKAGMLAPKVKSQYQLYSFKTIVVAQDEEPEDLKQEIAKLLDGEGNMPSEEELISLKPAVQESTQEFTERLVEGNPEVVEEHEGPQVMGEKELDITVEEMDSGVAAASGRIKELEAENEKLSAELESLRKDMVQVKKQADEKLNAMQEEREGLRAESDAKIKDIDGLKADLESKIKFLQEENEKAKSEKESLKGILEKKIQALEREKNGLEKDKILLQSDNKHHEAAINDLKASLGELKKENTDINNEFKKYKDKLAHKVKANFFNIKQLASAPVGSVWFESIVQIKTGDEAIFENGEELEKLKKASEKISIQKNVEQGLPSQEKKTQETLPEVKNEPEKPVALEEPVVSKEPEDPSPPVLFQERVVPVEPDMPLVPVEKDEPVAPEKIEEPEASVVETALVAEKKDEGTIEDVGRPEQVTLDFVGLDMDEEKDDDELDFKIPDVEEE